MSSLKSLLAASLLIAAGAAHATVVPVVGTVVGGGAASGSIDIDQDLENPNGTLSFLFGINISSGGNTWTGTLFTPATEENGLPGDVNAILPSIDALEDGFRATYVWGQQSANSNAASSFTGTGGSGWDWAELIVDVTTEFLPTSIVLHTREYSSAEDYAETTYNLAMDTAAVPVPAAAWMFGSGLIGLAGAARRRLKAA